ncbi:hypothetical protein ACLB2K_007950 [Fragaria x ananassa]
MTATISSIPLWKAAKFSWTTVNFSSTAADFSCQLRQSIIVSLFSFSNPYECDIRDYPRPIGHANILATPVNLATGDGESINSIAGFFRFALCTGQRLTVVRLSITISILDVRSSRTSTGKGEKKDKAPESVQRASSGEPERKGCKGKMLSV